MKNLENKSDEELVEMQKTYEQECNHLEEELRFTEQELDSIYNEIDRRKEV